MKKKTRVHFQEGNSYDSFDVDSDENKKKENKNIETELDKRGLKEDENRVWTEDK